LPPIPHHNLMIPSPLTLSALQAHIQETTILRKVHYVTRLRTYMHIRTKVSLSAYSEGMRPGREANHSTTFSAMARRWWRTTSTLPRAFKVCKKIPLPIHKDTPTYTQISPPTMHNAFVIFPKHNFLCIRLSHLRFSSQTPLPSHHPDSSLLSISQRILAREGNGVYRQRL
jgi:hypothetical protein